MGDRVRIQLVSGLDLVGIAKGKVEFGPVVYGHNAGSETPELVKQLATKMADRPSDIEYGTARLIEIMCGDRPGNLSVGVSNATALLTKDDSHGDAGCVLVLVDQGYKGLAVTGSGYLRNNEAGELVERADEDDDSDE